MTKTLGTILLTIPLFVSGCAYTPPMYHVYGPSGTAYTAPSLCQAQIQCLAKEASCRYDITVITNAAGAVEESEQCKEVKK